MDAFRARALACCLLGLVASTGWTQETPAAVTLPARERFHLYLLFGQSNMAGRGKLDDPLPAAHPRVLKFTAAHAWAPATEPLHFDVPRICGTGIGATFAREMADADPGVTIGLVPCAYSGSALEHWRPGGIRYEEAIARTRAAMKDGVVKGILWHQGETDGNEEDLARSYLDRLEQAIAQWRAALGQPRLRVVAGKLSDALSGVRPGGRFPYAPLVNEAIEGLPGRVPHTAVVSSKDLTNKGDGVHFDTPALREFGRRYARAMRSLPDVP